MNNLKKNQRGFSTVELVLAIVILVSVGIVGWLVYKNHHKTPSANSTTTTKATITTSTKPVGSYAGWQTYQMPFEKLIFKYPSNDYSINSHYGSMTQPSSYSDTVVLQGLNSTIFIEAVTNPGGINATEDYWPAPEYSIPASLAGQNGYINFYGSGQNSNSPISVIAFNTANNDYDFPTARNVSSPNSKYKTLSVYLTLGQTSNGPYQPLSTVLKSQYYNDFKLIVASMSY